MAGTDEVRKAQAGSGEEEELTVLARKHDACYEIWPAQTVLAGRKVAAGFELELLGVNEAHGPPQGWGRSSTRALRDVVAALESALGRLGIARGR